MNNKPTWKRWHKVLLSVIVVFIAGLMILISNTESAAPLPDTMTLAQKDSAQRMSTITSAFSAWDGSHKNLVKYVKAKMNDPESFEHVSTVYSDMGGDTLLLNMQYRGKNAFGGKVLASVRALAKLNGDIIKIEN